MAPKNNAKAAKGKGKDAADDKGKGGKAAVKGAQSINVRHILVCDCSLIPLHTTWTRLQI